MEQHDFLRLLIEYGLCATEDPDLFFPDHDERTAAFAEQAAEAKQICFRCPILSTCAEYSLTYEEYGIWGGMTPSERRKIRKEENIDPPNS